MTKTTLYIMYDNIYIMLVSLILFYKFHQTICQIHIYSLILLIFVFLCFTFLAGRGNSTVKLIRYSCIVSYLVKAVSKSDS